ncbi:MAG: hypothetical protein ACRDQ2_17400 [Gaiellales bacterium]
MRNGLLAVMFLALAGCGGDGGGNGGGGGGGGAEDEGFVNVTLAEKDGSGSSGTAILQPGAGSAEVTLELTNAADGAQMHVHKGSCDSAAGDTPVEHDLGFVTASLGQAILAVTIPEVATGEYYIDLHDAKDPTKIDACGQIPEQ